MSLQQGIAEIHKQMAAFIARTNLSALEAGQQALIDLVHDMSTVSVQMHGNRLIFNRVPFLQYWPRLCLNIYSDREMKLCVL
jgi:predicted lipoprotein